MPRAIQANHYMLVSLVINGLRRPEFLDNFLGSFSRNYLAQFFQAGAAHIRNAAKFTQKFLRGARTDSGNTIQCGFCLARGAPLAVKRYGEAMRLVANLLNEMKRISSFLAMLANG
jgi:hypothetical protein